MIRNFWIVESDWPKEFIRSLENCDYELRRETMKHEFYVGILLYRGP